MLNCFGASSGVAFCQESCSTHDVMCVWSFDFQTVLVLGTEEVHCILLKHHSVHLSVEC